MLSRARSRLLIPLLAVALAGTLTGCSLLDGDTAASPAAQPPVGAAAGGPVPEIPTTVAAGQVSLLQRLGAEGPLRTLSVERDGAWQCLDCAGDGVTSRGTLAPEQTERLQVLLADPRLAGETDQARQYRVTCIDALTSSLLTSSGLVTSQDCPGEERPPVAGEILLLLTQATPAEVKG
ncbi:hypothetical protein DKT68_24580 [Micromonospora acroterricola]|uniref:Uncharacterized protein n=1 Tax=Micromonospora acroterricola TaxID=2202421 RepID=A0A317CWK0_9ACTN|nr:hypothetical protein [Micromonospora acroterricola]PWR05896.1 hypothetical protein DKT68_24580 [Micromonospora acroterricola]